MLIDAVHIIIKHRNVLFVELPSHLGYLCLYGNENLPFITLSSIPERDRTLFMQILRKHGVEIKEGQDVVDTTGLIIRELDASDYYNDRY